MGYQNDPDGTRSDFNYVSEVGPKTQYYSKAVSPYRHSYLVQTVWCWLDGSSTDRSFLLAMPKQPHTNRVESNCVEPRFAKGAVRFRAMKSQKCSIIFLIQSSQDIEIFYVYVGYHAKR